MRSDRPAWKRLISDPLSTEERISLMTSIFSDHNEVKVVEYLSGDNAQTFIDVTYEASLHALSPPKDVPVDSPSTTRVLLVRCWKTFHQLPAGGVCVFYTGCVAAKPCFHDHWKFRFVTT